MAEMNRTVDVNTGGTDPLPTETPTKPLPKAPANGDRKPGSQADPIDEAIDESFPASDPPSQTPTTGSKPDQS